MSADAPRGAANWLCCPHRVSIGGTVEHRPPHYRRGLPLLILALLIVSTAAAIAPPASAATQVYVVQRGDTLARIATRHGTTVAAIVAANGLKDPNFIWVGQKLTITQGSGSSNPVPTRTPAPTPTMGPHPKPASNGRWIDVDLTKQRLTAYEGSQAVFTTLVSTGLARYPTVVGRFSVLDKVRSQAMSGPGYYLPNVPYVMHFYRSYAIHGTYWHNKFGQRMSHGCVNMTTLDAAWLYNWASVGIPVVTHY